MYNINIVESTFEEVLSLWQHHLWPERKSEILPTNTIKFMGGHDESLLKVQPVFLVALLEQDVAGAVSGFKTSEDGFRSRGLFVYDYLRSKGIATLLMRALEVEAKKQGASWLWTLPRKSSWSFYEGLGFQQCSDWDEEEYEFGPNCFAKKSLKAGVL